MKIKSIVTAIMMAGAFGAGAATLDMPGVIHGKSSPVLGKLTKTIAKKSAKPGGLSALEQKKQDTLKKAQAEYFKNNYHSGTKKYIVRLVDDAVPSYSGNKEGYPATRASSNNGHFDTKNPESIKYATYLKSKQAEVVQKAASKGVNLPVLKSLTYAINGIVTELSFDDARKLSKMPEVAFVEQSTMLQIETDFGPTQIGAANIWNGTATGVEYRGEGMLIGVIDTGVNTDHRSFAATGDDGYTVANPWGEGVYAGDCEEDASLCNSKLIGVYSYPDITDAYLEPVFDGISRPANGEDYNGHGSHTASTAGGNVLRKVPMLGADPDGGATGDGIPVNGTDFTFDEMSGVAPHANIISYQICLPGDPGDTYAGCASAAAIGAVDDAIADGVDVINYSIGGTTNFSPWTSATELAYLNASASGVYVAVSAGNSGPEPETTTKAAPWYTSVAATNHGRTLESLMAFGDEFYSYTKSQGPALPSDLDAPVVDAAVVDADNFEGCEAWPADAFKDSTALISRGTCAFAVKIDNAAAAGAEFVIVYNNKDGDDHFTMGGTGATTIPAVMVSQNTGAAMIAVLAATPGLVASFDPSVFELTYGQEDVLASFSSRGSNPFVEMVVPQIGAPGVNVYAAYADDQPFFDVNSPSPADFAFLSGTSMASPHLAGSAALVMQANPTWTPDEVRSALMMTATTANTTKEDGVTPTDHFDIGAGRVQVDQAVNAGLVMSETVYNYLQADPALGGDVKTLNTPSMANFNCEIACTWSRTFTAKTSGTYIFSTTNSSLSTSPGMIEAVEGNDYTVNFAFVAKAEHAGKELFENVLIQSDESPDLHLPVYVKVTVPKLPEKVDLVVGQNAGSYTVGDLYTRATDNLNVVLDGMYGAGGDPVAITEEFELAQDPTPSTAEIAYNDNYGDLYIGQEFDVVENALNMTVSLSNATSPDFDLYIEKFVEGNNSWELFDRSAGAGSSESVSRASPEAGKYRALVANWEASGPDVLDTGVINVNVTFQSDALSVVAIEQPAASNDGFTPFELKFVWDWDLVEGDVWTGIVSVMNGTELVDDFPLTLKRVSDDVVVSANKETAVRGELVDYTIDVRRNLYSDDMNYSLEINLPTGSTLVADSVEASGGTVDIVQKDPNAVGLNLSEDFAIAVDPTNSDPLDDLSQVFVYDFDIPAGTLSFAVAISDSTSPDNDLFVYFDSAGNESYISKVAQAATGETNEMASVNAPVAGKYRAVVQNYAGSGADLDTGTLTVTTVPATGEGFFATFSSPAVEAYAAVSSLTNASCAADAMSLFDAPIATPLIAFGEPTLGSDSAGDTFSYNVFDGLEFPFFGENKTNGMTFTDDGFLIFSGDSGTNPWISESIPGVSAPNDMISMLWRDMEVIDDGTRGVRTLTAYEPDYGFVVLDFYRLQTYHNPDEEYSFQLWAYTDGSWLKDAIGGEFDYIVSYGDLASNYQSSIAGVEDATGLFGLDVSDMIKPNSQICYKAGEAGSQYTINFKVQTTAASVNEPLKVTVESDLENSEDVTHSISVQLDNTAPIADAGADATIDRTTVASQVTLSALATVNLDLDNLSYQWTQVSGESVTLFSAQTATAAFSVVDLPNGSYTFEVEVSDGEFTSTDQVTITLTGKDTSTGSGPFGALLLLLLPFLWRRRVSK